MKNIVQVVLAAVFFTALAPAQTHPRIAVGGLSAESNSLYPARLVMTGGKLSRQEWMDNNAQASTVASGVIAASAKLGWMFIPS